MDVDLLRRDPYRLLFPLAILLSWAGVLHWLLLGLGIYHAYQATFHAMEQVQGALTCFAFGFLLTFIPRRTATPPVSLPTLGVFTLAPVATSVLAWLHLWVPAQLCWVGALVFLLGLVIRRQGRSRMASLHATFIWVPASLAAVMAASIAAGVGAAQGPGGMWIHDLGTQVILQGLFAGLVLGVGGMLIPVLTRGLDPGAPRPEAWRRRMRATNGGLAVIFFLSFVVDPWAPSLGLAIRGAVAAFALLYFAELWRVPTQPGVSRWLMWASGWAVPLGFLLAALFPPYWVAFLHVTFIGGFWLMALVVGSHVALSHGGAVELTKRWSGRLASSAALLCVAMAARILVNVNAAHFMLWLSIAAAAFLLAGLPWLALVIPVLRARAIPRSPAGHGGPLPLPLHPEG